MLYIVIAVLLLAWMFIPTQSKTDKERFNTLVVQISTGRVVALVYNDWNHSKADLKKSTTRIRRQYSQDAYDLVELSKSTISQYDLHIYTRD